MAIWGHRSGGLGGYASVDDLEEAIYDCLILQNSKPKPFVWAESAEDILRREPRTPDALDEIRRNMWQASDTEHYVEDMKQMRNRP